MTDKELPEFDPKEFGEVDVNSLPNVLATRTDLDKMTDRARVATTAEQQVMVWQLYISGCTNYRMIQERTGVPKSTAHRWIQGDLRSLNAERVDLAEHYLEVELQRLDKILELLMRDVERKIIDISEVEIFQKTYKDGSKGPKQAINKKTTRLMKRVDVDIVDRILKVQAQREKLLGLNAPKKIEKGEDIFDLEELLNAALKLQKGEMPKEFIEAEFTEEGQDGKEESNQEENGEEGREEKSGQEENGSNEDASIRNQGDQQEIQSEEGSVLDDFVIEEDGEL